MTLLRLEKVHLAHGEQVIFDDLDLTLAAGDRLCILGRNGVGKTTLLKTLAGEIDPDSGGIWRDPATHLASLSQALPTAEATNVWDFVAAGLPGLGSDLALFAHLSGQTDPASVQALGQVQQRIEAVDGWRMQNQIDQTITRLGLDGEALMADLSGGWRRRVALARALVSQPDVLLLDEPTNHLDIPTIEWLEEQINAFSGAVVLVSHDRAFVQNTANRIGELDRGKMTLWRGTLSEFARYREQQLEQEERHRAAFDKRLAQEETWIRQGIKARRTRNEGRVRALEAMRSERAARLERQSSAKMTLASETVSGKLVVEFEQVSFAFDNKVIVRDFSTIITRGDKIGLIGPNGIGKTTFLKLLVGELAPTSGRIRLGTKLEVAYFDQLRKQIDLDKSAVDNIAQGREFILVQGREKHMISYLQDFLFTGERARTPVRALSGGERNRVLLAKLFSQPANLLIMDEPTNDLDAETLELLEELLLNYSGTLLLVSHDRSFLDNVVTSTIGFEGGGELAEYVGGYQDWRRQGGHWPDFQGQGHKPEQNLRAEATGPSEISSMTPSQPGHSRTKTEAANSNSGRKLSYKLQLELDRLPQLIEQAETDIASLQQKVSDPDFYQSDATTIARETQKLAELESHLDTLYHRWQELEQ